MNGDTPDVPYDDAEIAEEAAEVSEEAAAFARPPIGAVTPIRDPADEPFVFRFEVGPAILVQLLEKLRQLTVSPLLSCLDARYPGFYQLFLDGRPVYIGKTSRPIGVRLREHVKKIRGRIDFARMEAKFAYVEDPSLVDVAEGALINFFDSFGEADWNQSGFGSKTTGFGRAGTRGADWDTLFPPDLDWPIEAGLARPITLAQHIAKINRQAPITFTIPREHRAAFNAAHPSTISVPVTTSPFREWVEWVSRELTAGWTIRREPRSWYIVPA